LLRQALDFGCGAPRPFGFGPGGCVAGAAIGRSPVRRGIGHDSRCASPAGPSHCSKRVGTGSECSASTSSMSSIWRYTAW
jgi:hypothetical protein